MNAEPQPRDLALEQHEPGSLRLTGPQWLVVGALVLLALWLLPWVWTRAEAFDPPANYRLPYALSDDYWLYQRHLAAARSAAPVYVVGDSVVWGEYVRADGTLSHFLSRRSGVRFVNAGVNGLFPLALEGLIDHYGRPIRNQKVLLHANLLWTSSPRADLNLSKEEKFNHVGLVPQFSPRIPCYKADLDARLGRVVRRQVPFFGWVEHLQDAYFEQQNVLAWTLSMEDGDPPRHPNAYRGPLSQITLRVPEEPAVDPQRGPSSNRHRPWSSSGLDRVRFEWVDLEGSLQWASFRRLARLLVSRGNEVFVLVGPFNEHLLLEENVAAYRKQLDQVAAWLRQEKIAHAVPESLSSELYGDASHPLTEGYARLAELLMELDEFREFMVEPK